MAPPVSFNESGFPTLAACLLHVGRGLGSDFPRIYVRLHGACVGEQEIFDLRFRFPSEVAQALVETYRAVQAAAQGAAGGFLIPSHAALFVAASVG